MSQVQERFEDDFDDAPREVHLAEYWAVVVKRWRIVAVCVAAALVAAAGKTILTTPLYRATVVINVEKDRGSPVDIGGQQYLRLVQPRVHPHPDAPDAEPRDRPPGRGAPEPGRGPRLRSEALGGGAEGRSGGGGGDRGERADRAGGGEGAGRRLDGADPRDEPRGAVVRGAEAEDGGRRGERGGRGLHRVDARGPLQHGEPGDEVPDGAGRAGEGGDRREGARAAGLRPAEGHRLHRPDAERHAPEARVAQQGLRGGGGRPGLEGGEVLRASEREARRDGRERSRVGSSRS